MDYGNLIEKLSLGPLRVAAIGLGVVFVIWAVAKFFRKFGSGD